VMTAMAFGDLVAYKHGGTLAEVSVILGLVDTRPSPRLYVHTYSERDAQSSLWCPDLDSTQVSFKLAFHLPRPKVLQRTCTLRGHGGFVVLPSNQ